MSVGTGLGDSERKLENISPRCIYETRYVYANCTELYISITQANSIRKGCTSCVGLGWGGSTYVTMTIHTVIPCSGLAFIVVRLLDR